MRQADEEERRSCSNQIIDFLASVVPNARQLDAREIHQVALLIFQADKLCIDNEGKMWAPFISFARNATSIGNETCEAFVRVLLNKLDYYVANEGLGQKGSGYWSQRISFAFCLFETSASRLSREIVRDTLSRLCSLTGILLCAIDGQQHSDAGSPELPSAETLLQAIATYSNFFRKAIRPQPEAPSSSPTATFPSSSPSSSSSSYHKRLRSQVAPMMLAWSGVTAEAVVGLARYMLDDLRALASEFELGKQPLDNVVDCVGTFLACMATATTRFCRQVHDSILRDLLLQSASALRSLINKTNSATVQHVILAFLLAQSCCFSSASLNSVTAQMAQFILCRLVKTSATKTQVVCCKSIFLILENSLSVGFTQLQGLCATLRSLSLVLSPNLGHVLADHVCFLLVSNWKRTTSFAAMLGEEENDTGHLDHLHQKRQLATVSCGDAELLFRHLPLSQLGPSVAPIVDELISRALAVIASPDGVVGGHHQHHASSPLPSKSFALLVLNKLHASLPAARYSSVKAHLNTYLTTLEDYINAALPCSCSLHDDAYLQFTNQSGCITAFPPLNTDMERLLNVFSFLKFVLETYCCISHQEALTVVRGLARSSAFACSKIASILCLQGPLETLQGQQRELHAATIKAMVEAATCCCQCIEMMLHETFTPSAANAQQAKDVLQISINLLCAGCIKAPPKEQWRLFLIISKSLLTLKSPEVLKMIPENWTRALCGRFHGIAITLPPAGSGQMGSEAVAFQEDRARRIYHDFWQFLTDDNGCDEKVEEHVEDLARRGDEAHSREPLGLGRANQGHAEGEHLSKLRRTA